MELQTLGESMPKPEREEPLPPPTPKVKLSVAQYLMDVVSRHPEGVTPEDAKAYIKSARPESTTAAYYSALSTLVLKGVLKKLPSGKITNGGVTFIAKPGRIPHHLRVPKTEKPVLVAHTEEKPTSVDKDLKALDEALNDALNALTKIDSISQRIKAKLARFAKIQELLK
jgi:hypothetical protein